ncbi:kynureninase [Kutzneria sp. 744]|uniref:kynureninase n=1 Tax=Kutzneria sp. (strain 744) TaxID=345341 RepID=UPI0003EEA4FD|nr:kynureninase [Kutzneria sp. 744]EWM11206.1 kynureninase [Kutzneria sp. 744]
MSDLTERAAKLDADDPLAGRRDLFDLDDGVVYLDGNSLGALPRHVPAKVADVLTRQWGRMRIRSWTEGGWWEAPERIGDRIAPLVGAAPGHVVVGDSTSVNVFRAVISALRMTPGRAEILVDATTFPTDGYIAASAARLAGATVRAVHPAEVPTALSGNTAVVLLNHVDYRSGRLHDMGALTAAVHNAGARVIWDLSHSAGALPVDLKTSNVDFAVGCTYKYLNGGPGAPAFFAVRPDLLPQLDQPLGGWCSHREPFAMDSEYVAAEGIAKARAGTPEIVSLLTLDAALDVWDGVDLHQLRQKSLALTGFFEDCVAELAPAARSVTPEIRGSQVSLSCVDAERVMGELIARGVVGDHRPPDLLRFGFTPLYTRFVDALRAAEILGEILA